MSAIDQKHLIEIFSINLHAGHAKKTGNPFEIYKAQCLIKGPDNSQQIGELNVSKELAAKTPPGKYLAEFELGVNFDRLVIPRVVALHPWRDVATLSPAAAAATGREKGAPADDAKGKGA